MTIITCPNCGAKNRIDERRAQTEQPVCGRCKTRLDPRSARGGADAGPVVVTDANFGQQVLGAPAALPVLVDCWAAWCGPCRTIGPVIDQLAAESGGRYRVGKLNVDENSNVAAQFRIESIPALLIFKGGRLVDQLVGVQPKQVILSRLQAQIA